MSARNQMMNTANQDFILRYENYTARFRFPVPNTSQQKIQVYLQKIFT